MTEINIGGRVVPLSYSAYEMVAIQKEIGCTAFQLNDVVFGITREENEEKPDEEPKIRIGVVNDADRLEKMGKLIAILGNAGLEESGQEGDLTAKWILRNMKPVMILIYAIAVMAVINAGNFMEAKEEEKTGEPVDAILEEEKAKKQQGS